MKNCEIVINSKTLFYTNGLIYQKKMYFVISRFIFMELCKLTKRETQLADTTTLKTSLNCPCMYCVIPQCEDT